MKTGKVNELVVAELLRCELALLDPEVRRNRRRLEALLAEDFSEVGATGRVWSRAEVLEMLTSEEFSPPAVENFACREIGKGIMLVTYRTVRASQENSDRLVAFRSSIWSRAGGRWKLRFHQGTRLP